MKRVDVLVIGGGIAGISAAARFAQHARTVVLERESALGYHSSGRSATFWHFGIGCGVVRGLTAASRDFFADPPGGENHPPLSQAKSALFISPAETLDQLTELEREMRRFSNTVTKVGPAEMLDIVPCLKAGEGGAVAGLLDTGCRKLDADLLLQTNARLLREAGGQIVLGAAVTAITHDGADWIVDTTEQSYAVRTIVNAAGAWADEVAIMANVPPLGLMPLRRTIISLAYAVNEEGFSRLFLYDRASRRTAPIPGLPRGVLTGLGFSPDGKRLAVSLSTATSAGDVWTVEPGTGTLTRWTRSELGEVDPAALSEPELVRFKSFDGLSVPAFVYNPKNRRPGQRTPVIIDIHGGPEAQSRPGWNPGAQYFADVLGATVILPNVRGSDGFGTRYLNLDNGPLRENSVKDIGALLDWIAGQPNLDPSRVAVYGQSYGGYMSLASMIHFSDRLVGGVERYGISDFQTFLKNTEAYRRDNRRAEYGDERDPAMRAVFDRISPLARVGRITKPMLVMQGSNDPRVPQSESDQVVAGIRAKGVPVGYVVFADEGHGFLKKPNNDLRRQVETVFLRQLFEKK